MSCYVLYPHVLLFPLLTVGDILLPVFFIVRICSSTGVVISQVLSVGTGVNGLSHPIVYGATVQATIIFSSVMGVNCFSHPKLVHGC